jgi:hypothetical protein
MRLRYIKRAHARWQGSIWPPRFGSPVVPTYARANGVLIAVHRIGHRLALTIRYEGQDYVTLLDPWKSPPTLDEMEATFLANIGRTIRDVGEAEIGHAVPKAQPTARAEVRPVPRPGLIPFGRWPGGPKIHPVGGSVGAPEVPGHTREVMGRVSV